MKKLPDELMFLEHRKAIQLTTDARIDGKTVVITGATSGVGLEALKKIILNDVHVFLVARNINKAKDLINSLNKHNNTKIDIIESDFSLLSDVRKAAEEIKDKTIELIKKDLGKVDLVVYSLAAPRRTDSEGKIWSSCLKTTGEAFTEKSLDLRNNEITEKTVEPATEEEVLSTVKVMGGEDWADWIDALKAADVLTENAVTVAYSYIGPELTYPIYYHGTIGTAKQHLQKTMSEINQAHPDVRAVISVNKGLVTQASAAIPVVPLYFAILYKVMKRAGNHENCIQQIARLFTQKLYTPEGFRTDENGFIRMDDYELLPEIQEEVKKCWKAVTTDTVNQYCDIDGYWEDFYHMFGFHYSDIDYTQDVDANVEINGIVM